MVILEMKVYKIKKIACGCGLCEKFALSRQLFYVEDSGMGMVFMAVSKSINEKCIECGLH